MKEHRPARSYPRLTRPLVRTGGSLRPATWDDALDVAAAGFRRNLEARGPDALGIFSCSKSTNEVNFLAQKLARVAFGTTTSTAATARDTPLASSVWRRYSARGAARAPTAKSRRRRSSSCGDRTPARRIRSGSTTC